MKILVAEDEPALRQNLSLLLELEGFEVIAVEDGQQALEQIESLGPDLLVTDVLMPRLDGFGLVQRLRAQPAYVDLPIIMLTARAERSDQRQGMRSGADDYLLKPYRSDELLDAIRTQLFRRQQRRRELPGLQTDRARQINTALAEAIDQQQFCLHYQPQVNLLDGQVIGFEALLRWQHPQLGWVPPAEFIPIAEASGQIIGIGSWVLREATRQAALWCSDGLPPLRIAVNLSIRQLEGTKLVQLVEQCLAQASLPAGLLELEITESLAMHDLATTLNLLRSLKDLGVQLAMDDFGTGYSSLNYLRHYPIDSLKIDQSFVRNAVLSRADRNVVQAIVGMARGFELGLVAEGIETAEHLELIRELGCVIGQGYFFSRPVPAEQAVTCLTGYADRL
jgi:EAL domain-containing protein (putative c-di-GMP-specific phosphodiesterase class I)/FixJ family two-component response regulator